MSSISEEEEKEERERMEKGEGKGKFPMGSTMDICEAKVAGWDRLREKWYRREDMYCMFHFLIYIFFISFFYLSVYLSFINN